MIVCAVTIGLLSFALYSVGVAVAAPLLGSVINNDDPTDQFFLGLWALLWPAPLLAWMVVQIGKFGQG